MAESETSQHLVEVTEYSVCFQGFVKITVDVTGRSSLAYQIPQQMEDAQLYLLDSMEFGQVVLASLVRGKLPDCPVKFRYSKGTC